MVEVAHYLEFLTKLLFGANLSLAFSGISRHTHPKEYNRFLLGLALTLNGSLLLLGELRTIHLYPILIHLPIIVFLHKVMKVSLLHAMVSLFLAFQFLSPRQWLGIFAASFFKSDLTILNITTVLLSFPFTILVERYFAPEIVALKNEDSKMLLMIGLAPICYYIMTYVMVIYTDIMVDGGAGLMKLIDGSFVLAFILYTFFSLKIFQERKRLEVERAILLVMQQAGQAELKQLHKQESLTQLFRHDLRHHIHYLISLMKQKQTEAAIAYMENILAEQDKQVVYASDESVHLLVSQYEATGRKDNITMDIHLETKDFSGFDQLNLCCLISNGMENALKFSKDHLRPYVSLEVGRKEHQLTLVMKNTYQKIPVFHNSRPITQEQGHGFGTKSMANIVEQYNGFSQFSLEGEYFIFRATLMAEDYL